MGLVEVTGTCLTCLNKNLRSSVTITVVESVSILPAPPPILIATGNPVQLMVERLKYDGEGEVLPIGAAHYTWRSGHDDIVSVNKNTGLAVGNRAGLAEVRKHSSIQLTHLPRTSPHDAAAQPSGGSRSPATPSQAPSAPISCFGLGQPLRCPVQPPAALSRTWVCRVDCRGRIKTSLAAARTSGGR